MIERMDAKSHDERERLFKAEKGFFDHFFGDEPIGPERITIRFGGFLGFI